MTVLYSITIEIKNWSRLFFHTLHIEVSSLLEQQKRSKDIIEIGIDAGEYYRIKDSEKEADEK